MGFYLKSSGWQVNVCDSSVKALDKISEGFGDIIISDIKMPEMDGITLLGKVKEINPDVEVLMITGHSNEALAIEALKAGANDYFRKPLNAEEIISSLHRTRRFQEIRTENRKLKALVANYNSVDDKRGFFGESPVAKGLLSQLNKVSSSPDATVLLTGESGAGKEIAARLIHKLSGGNDKPFVALNCGGLPENLLESELFGHEKGAFTGADKVKPGVFELASGGTVLLDEISEMSMSAQSRFLRVLEERTFRRVGGTKEISFAGTRVIAATNKDLQVLVEEEKFRHDLYHRINIVTINVPSLKERKEDIIPLANHFLSKHSETSGEKYMLTPGAEKTLLNYDFPGNIRELKNMIERATIFCNGGKVAPSDLGLKADLTEPQVAAPVMSNGSLNLADHEIMLIRSALENNPNNHSAAARSLGITPQALYRKMEKYSIAKV